MGSPYFGVSSNPSCFWGNVTTKTSNPALNPLATTRTLSINQPENPDFGRAIKCSGYGHSKKGSDMHITWYLDPTSAPMLSYEFRQYDANGKDYKTLVKQSRPDVRSCVLKGVYNSGGKIEFRATDIFGNTSTYVIRR